MKERLGIDFDDGSLENRSGCTDQLDAVQAFGQELDIEFLLEGLGFGIIGAVNHASAGIEHHTSTDASTAQGIQSGTGIREYFYFGLGKADGFTAVFIEWALSIKDTGLPENQARLHLQAGAEAVIGHGETAGVVTGTGIRQRKSGKASANYLLRL